MAEFLASKGLSGVAKCAVGPAAVRCARETVKLITSCKCKHDGEGKCSMMASQRVVEVC